jgi:signal peptidase I
MIRRLVAALVVVAALAAVAAFAVYGKAYRIPSASMEPTLHCGRPGVGCTADSSDRVLALRLWWPLRGVSRGDLVAYRTPPAALEKCGAGGTFLHRVVGLPGETWEQRRGRIFIDGRPLPERYVQPRRRDRQRYARRRIPSGRYLMLGDNRIESCDSRVWGTVPRENLIAKIVAGYWPPSRIGFR